MRMTVMAIALLMSGAAFAQTTTDYDTTDMDTHADHTTSVNTTSTDTTADTSTESSTTVNTTSAQTTMASSAMPGQVVQPSNANPEEDARGIAVISDPAVVPAGWTGVTGTAMGGPLVDPVTGETVTGDDESYPACTATVTDNCLQTYERGRSR